MHVRACLRCSHDLTGVPNVGGLRTCPECGERNPPFFQPPDRSRWAWALLALTLALAPITAFFVLTLIVDSMELAMIAFPAFILCGVVGGLGASVPATIAVLGPRVRERSITGKVAICVLAAFLVTLTMALVGFAAATITARFVFKGHSFCRETPGDPGTPAINNLALDAQGIISHAGPPIPEGVLRTAFQGAPLPGTSPPCDPRAHRASTSNAILQVDGLLMPGGIAPLPGTPPC